MYQKLYDYDKFEADLFRGLFQYKVYGKEINCSF